MNIGVLGGGQLGRMLALAGFPLGHEFVFLDPAPEALCGLGSRYPQIREALRRFRATQTAAVLADPDPRKA